MSEKWLALNWWEIALVPLVISAILGLMAAVRFCASRYGIAAELQRKIIHVAVGSSALFFPLLFSSPLPVFILIACAILVMLRMRSAKAKSAGIGSVLHSVERPSYGEIYLALSVAFLFFRSDANPILYVLPLLVVTLSDTASALVGSAYGKMRFPVQDGSKSIEGVIAFFIVTWIVAMIALLLLSDTARLNVIVISFLIAAFCALIEADSWRGLDNLLVPVGAHLVLERHLGSAPQELLSTAILFTVAVLIIIRYCKLLDLTQHAARSYAIMLFLTITTIHPVHAIIPVATILAHIAARKWNPSRSQTPDLDFLAAATAVGLIWLLAGEAIERTVLYLFAMSFVGASVILMTLAARGKDVPFFIRHMPLPLAILLMLICTFIVWIGATGPYWYLPFWPPILACAMMCWIVAIGNTEWFEPFRAPKTFAVAMFIPVIIYVKEGVLI